MKLSQCKMGTVVQTNLLALNAGKIGHIVGFAFQGDVENIPSNEEHLYTIPVVRFPGGDEHKVNHNNLEIYEG